MKIILLLLGVTIHLIHHAQAPIEFYSDQALTKKISNQFSGNENVYIKINFSPNLLKLCRSYKEQLAEDPAYKNSDNLLNKYSKLTGRKSENFYYQIYIVAEGNDTIFRKGNHFNHHSAEGVVSQYVALSYFKPGQIITGGDYYVGKGDLWLPNYANKSAKSELKLDVLVNIEYRQDTYPSSGGGRIGSKTTGIFNVFKQTITYTKDKSAVTTRNFEDLHSEDRMKTPGIREEVAYQLEKMDEIEKVHKVTIKDIDWDIYKDKYTKKVLFRRVTIHALVKLTDGNCAAITAVAAQEYAGNGYSNAIYFHTFRDKHYRGERRLITRKQESYCACP